ncbi:MAG: hypothetical protein HQL32_15235 [Planctomycetes bacterium]|nr:hypothetical protein [Planctomycetota bacterium]
MKSQSFITSILILFLVLLSGCLEPEKKEYILSKAEFHLIRDKIAKDHNITPIHTHYRLTYLEQTMTFNFSKDEFSSDNIRELIIPFENALKKKGVTLNYLESDYIKYGRGTSNRERYICIEFIENSRNQIVVIFREVLR